MKIRKKGIVCAAAILLAVFMVGEIDTPVEVQATTEKQACWNVDFSGANVGDSIQDGSDKSRFGRIVGIAEGKTATVKEDADGTKYGSVKMQETSTTGDITAFSYNGKFTGKFNQIKIRMRIQDYNSTTTYQHRFHDANNTETNPPLHYLVLKEGNLTFMGQEVDGSIWGSANNKVPLNTWIEFKVDLDCNLISAGTITGALSVNGIQVLSEAVATVNTTAAVDGTSNNYRFIIGRKAGTASQVDLAYYQGSTIITTPDEGEESVVMNVDFSASTIGGSIGGNGNTSFGKTVGIVDGSSATVVEGDNNKYGSIIINEGANSGNQLDITSLSYKTFSSNKGSVYVRMRLHDFNSKIASQFRMDYTYGGVKTEQVIELFNINAGNLTFLGTSVDASVWGTADNKAPLNEWIELRVDMNFETKLGAIYLNGTKVKENTSFAVNELTSIESTGNNFRFIVTHLKNKGDTKVDIDYMRVSAILPQFDPWTRIELTEAQSTLVNVLLGANEEKHPSIYFTAENLTSFREKINSGYSKQAWERLVEEIADFDSKLNLDEYTFGTATSGRLFQKHVGYFAFFGLMIENDIYIQKAKTVLLKGASVTPETAYGLNDALAVGDMQYGLVLGYDWLYNHLTEEEKLKVEKSIIAYAEWLFDHSFTEAYGNEEVKRLVWNWNSVTHGTLGMAALVLDDGALGEKDTEIRKQWLSRAIQRMEGYCTYSKDADGLSYEGMSYLGYGMHSLVPLADLINSRIEYNWLEQFDHIKEVPSCTVQMNAPTGNGEGYWMNQGTYTTHFSTNYYLINLFGDREGLWGFDKINYLEKDNYWTVLNLDWAGNGCQLPQIIAFENQSLEAVKPTTIFKTFEQGVVIARESFEDDSAMFTFRSALGNQSTWNHPDTNTFAFWAKEEAFIVDPGAGYTASAHHNVVMVDGNGLNGEGGSTMNPGTMEVAKDYGTAVYAKGDAIGSYTNKVKATTADRHVVFGRGIEPYVFTYDDFRIDEKSHAYTINYLTKASNSLTLLDGINGIRMVGGNTGSQCLAIFFDEKPVNLTITDVDSSYKSIVANVSDANLSMGALFISTDHYGNLPILRQTKTDYGMLLELYLSDNRLDTITVVDGVISYETSAYTQLPSTEETGIIDLRAYEVTP